MTLRYQLLNYLQVKRSRKAIIDKFVKFNTYDVETVSDELELLIKEGDVITTIENIGKHSQYTSYISKLKLEYTTCNSCNSITVKPTKQVYLCNTCSITAGEHDASSAIMHMQEVINRKNKKIRDLEMEIYLLKNNLK